ncbi:hypothetical protein C8T65DRAFT_757136 [Cerioporus squamosus]|nr:hypothetical protein C8T65DRAFT_757136 [Cerioporus squamosus]
MYYLLVPFSREFPSELEDIIIDQLRDDTRSLRQCALTCRAWHIHSRFHLSTRLTSRNARADTAQFSPVTSGLVATHGSDLGGGTVHLWDVEAGTILHTIQQTSASPPCHSLLTARRLCAHYMTPAFLRASKSGVSLRRV